MSIKSLTINCVESIYTQEYIANTFWKQQIARISSVTLIPFTKNGEKYNIAYINVDQWCDSENAYNFIRYLNNPFKETRLVHHEDNWWPVEINTHNNGSIDVDKYTVHFTSDYFQRSTNQYNLWEDCLEKIRNNIDVVQQRKLTTTPTTVSTIIRGLVDNKELNRRKLVKYLTENDEDDEDIDYHKQQDIWEKEWMRNVTVRDKKTSVINNSIIV